MQRLQFFTPTKNDFSSLLEYIDHLLKLVQLNATQIDKKMRKSHIEGTEKWRLHLRSVHLTLDSIKLSGIQHHDYEDRNELNEEKRETYPFKQKSIVLTLHYKNGEKQHYAISDFSMICDIVKNVWLLSSTFNKTEFYSKIPDDKVEGFSDEWDEYWSEFNEIEEVIAYYDRVSDIAIMDILKLNIESLKTLAQHEKQLVIADLGAGNGRLAKKIIDLISPHIPIHYLFLEPNKVEFESAQNMLKEYAQSDRCQITWLNIPFEKMQLDVSAHCVISSGGPLNTQIVPTNEAAQQNLLRIRTLLVSDGLLIATGYSGIFINSHRFEKSGFNVLSSSAKVELPDDMSDYLKTETKFNMTYYPFMQRYVCVNQQQVPFELSLDVRREKSFSS